MPDTPVPISATDDTYTRDEIDNLMVNFSNELKEMVDNVITMSEPSIVPNPEDTSMWMEVVEAEETGDFSDWYYHNSTLDGYNRWRCSYR